MLKFFFNRHSKMVLVLEVIGLISALFLLGLGRLQSGFQGILFSVFFSFYSFIRFCDFKDWYPDTSRKDYPDKKIGIQAHFQKSMVPTSYIFGITNTILLLQIPYLSTALLFLTTIMLFCVGTLDLILVYFHFKDSDPLPINFFSANLYKKSEKSHLRIAASGQS